MAETTESQEPVISRGGIQLMLRALKSVDVSDFVKYSDLFEKAVGCISNYCETRSCQLFMAPDTVALDRMLKYALQGPTNSLNNIFIADTFYRISYSLVTHRHLCNPVILGQIFEVVDRCLKISDGGDEDSITIYTLLMCVGRILILTTLTGVTVPEERMIQAEDLIQKFFKIANMKAMRALQEKYSNNWGSLILIIEPILTPEHSCGLLNQNKVKKLFYFSLTVELPRKRLLQVARKEKLLEYLTCLSWYAPTEDVKGSYVGSLSAAQLVEVPRLSTITRAKIAVVSPLGFISAQQPAHSIVRQLMNKRNMKEEQF